jgi:hypothetical protein
MRGVGIFGRLDQTIDVLGTLHNRVDAGHGGVKAGPGPQVTVDVFDVVAAAVTTSASAEDAHIRTGGEQPIDNDLAKGAGAAGDKCAGRHTLTDRIGPPNVTAAGPQIAICPGWR